MAWLSCSWSLQWCHNEHDGLSNHRHLDCLLNHVFRHRSKKTPKLRGTGLCEGNSPVTGEFPTQRASNAENVSSWWRYSDSLYSGSEHSQFNSPRLVKREAGFPTHGGRWLAPTNYDALMTHHTTENSSSSTQWTCVNRLSFVWIKNMSFHTHTHP